MTYPPDPADDLLPLLRTAYPAPEPPEHFSAALVARMRQALPAAAAPSGHGFRRWRPYLATAASLAMGIALARYFWQSPARPLSQGQRGNVRLAADAVQSPEAVELAEIANSASLTKEEKIARLMAKIESGKALPTAFYWLTTIDEPRALQAALALFRAKESPAELKLEMGRLLLKGDRPKNHAISAGFVNEFAAYLIGAILDGGQAEFCRVHDGRKPTAVGEYATLAGNFEGYNVVDFTPFKDARLVPILIACLDAPDIVYPVDQGDVIRGKPGESTGRSGGGGVAIALAKLADARAIEPLKNKLAKHPDIYLRMNAAYALARLIDKKEDRVAVGKTLLASPEQLACRFPFGKGLIESGDDNGVEFLALRHATGVGPLDNATSVLYVIEQRITILQGFKSPKVETFLREAFAMKALRAMFLFEPGSVKEYGYAKDEAAALEMAGPRIIKIYDGFLKCVETNTLKGFAADLEGIAKETRNEQIRERTKACLKTLAP